jgi:hypothetical protein
MINQEEMLSVLLASTARWQSETGAASAQEALEQIKGYQASDDADPEDGDQAVGYPRAVIEWVEKRKSAAGTATWRGGGALLLSLEAQPPEDELATIEDQRAWFVDLVGTLDEQMRTLSGSRATPSGFATTYSTSHFQIREISWSVEPFLVSEAEREELSDEADALPRNLWACQLRIEY